MSAVNDFGIPNYAKPTMDDINKAFPNGMPSVFEQLKSQLDNDIKEIQDGLDDDNHVLDENCPSCGHEYDQVDFEYQICHICHYQNQESHTFE